MKETINTYDAPFYAKVIDNFVETGSAPSIDFFRDPRANPNGNAYEKYLVRLNTGDPLLRYMHSVMTNPFVLLQVMTSEVCAAIFRDTMYNMVALFMDKQQFHLQVNQSNYRQIAEAREWSVRRQQNGWQALMQKAEQSTGGYLNTQPYMAQFENPDFWDVERRKTTQPMKQGDEPARENPDAWNAFLDDWEELLIRRIGEKTSALVSNRLNNSAQLLQNNLRQIPEFLSRHDIPEAEFLQAWGMMGGIWNEREFDKLYRIVLLQQKYPEIVEMAERMGRVPDGMGRHTARVKEGGNAHLPHATRSDILGVSAGNNLAALLPTELAVCTDDELEDVFNYRFHNRQLQTFEFRSESKSPDRHMRPRRARQTGPMVVCLDTSASMNGRPFDIAMSLLMYLLRVSERMRRDLYVIAFAVYAHPIDVKQERARLLQLLSQRPSGSTSAQHMLTKSIELLATDPRFANADVLWLSDFRIPMLPADRLHDMALLRSQHTRLYALQIGTADHAWRPHFDAFEQIHWMPRRKY